MQAANIAPVNKGEVIWTLDIVTLMRIGSLALTGKRDFTTLVAVTGPEVEKPCVVRTCEGAGVSALLSVASLRKTDHHIRIISGNVLTGVVTTKDTFIHYPYRQITVIAEGDDRAEFMAGPLYLPPRPA